MNHNQEVIKHLKGFRLKASELTHNGETYVIGEIRGQRFSIKFKDGKYRLYGGYSGVTEFNSTNQISQVWGMVENWAV